MKKKILFILISIISFGTIVNASTNTYERKTEENYNSKKVDIDTDTKKKHVLNTPYVDASEKVYDFAEELTEEEEQKLYKKIMEFIDEYDTELIILTINKPFSDEDNDAFADDFYDYNDFGIGFDKYDGIVLLHNAHYSNKYYNYYTFGNAQLYFGPQRDNKILDYIYNDLKNSKFYTGFDKFIDKAAYFYIQGRDPELKDYEVDNNGYLYKRYVPPIFGGVLISVIVVAISMAIMVKKNKMVRKAYYASEYLDKESINYRKSEDKFIRTYVTKTYIPPSSSGSSGGGGGGHSSHSGSSGRGYSSGSGRHL